MFETTPNIRRPRVAKHVWRTEGEPFDPAKVARPVRAIAAVTELDGPAWEDTRLSDLVGSL